MPRFSLIFRGTALGGAVLLFALEVVGCGSDDGTHVSSDAGGSAGTDGGASGTSGGGGSSGASGHAGQAGLAGEGGAAGTGACVPTEIPEGSCSDTLDNDCDGLADDADPDCVPPGDIYYVTQDGEGLNDGSTGLWTVAPTSPASAMSLANFNDAANWSAVDDSNKIDPGSTVYFSGTFHSPIAPPTGHGGMEGLPVTLDGYEDGACNHMAGTDTRAALVSVPGLDGVEFDGNAYVVIQDFRVNNCSTAIHNTTGSADNAPDHITIRRVSMDGNENGVYFSSPDSANSGGTYVTIEDCEVVDTAVGDTSSAKAAIRVANMQDLIIRRNHVYQRSGVALVTNGQDGIMSWHNHRVLVESNRIHHVSEDCIDVKNDVGNDHGDYIIRFNVFYDARQSGITLQHETGHNAYVYGNQIYGGEGTRIAWDGILIQRGFEDAAIWANIIRDADKSGIAIYDHDAARPVDDAVILNNTIVNNRINDTAYQHSGIALWNSNGGAYWVKNNLLVDNSSTDSDRHEIYVSPEAASDTELDHNLYFDYSETARIHWNGAFAAPGTQDPSAVVDNPRFTNWSERDLTLESASPARNAGVTVSSHPAWWSVPTIQNVDYTSEVRLDRALDPGKTDWTTTPPTVVMVDQNLKGAAWEIGAYA